VGPPGLAVFSNVLIYKYLKTAKSKNRVKIRVKCLAVKFFELHISFNTDLYLPR
jgi:hypothetical protein